MAEDRITAGVFRRGKELDVARKRTEALLAEYEADNNEEGISECLGEIALIRAQGNALSQEFSEHIQRTTAPQPEADDSGEWMHRKKLTPDDALKTINYGKMPGDPSILSVDDYNRQLRVMAQKKANGEYST